MHIGIASTPATFWRSAARVVTGGDAMPAVGVFANGSGGWEVRDDGGHAPSGYVVTNDGGVTFEVDTTASQSEGLTLQITAGRPEVIYP